MLTINAEIAEAVARKNKVLRIAVSYRKRYWSVSAQAFTFTGAYVEIARKDVASVGPSREALDNGNVNEFKAGNVTLELRNERNLWSSENPGGYFKRDGTALLGYEKQLTDFKIEVFYIRSDGAEGAAIALFTGHAVAWDQYPNRKTVAVTLESKHCLLRLGNAENVVNRFTNKALVGAVDGVNKIFTTAEVGVGRFNFIYVNGTPQKLGVDVVITNLSIHNLAATLTFAAAPPALATVTATYAQWKRDQKIHTLVAALATEAGIDPAMQAVQAVFYATGVINTRTYTSQADWDGGAILQNIDTGIDPGSFARRWYLFDNFDDLEYATNQPWTLLDVSGDGIGGAGAGYFELFAQVGRTSFNTPFSRLTGTWSAIINMLKTGAGGSTAGGFFFFVQANASANISGYCLHFRPSDTTVYISRFDGGVETTLVACGAWPVGPQRWSIERTSAGVMNAYLNGVLMGTFTDNTYNVCQNVAIRVNSVGGGTSETFRIDDMFYSPHSDSGPSTPLDGTSLWESQTVDCGADLSQYLNVLASANAPAGTSVLIETATANESAPGSGLPGTFDTYVAVDISGRINSTLRRFIKIRITLGTLGVPNFLSPTVLDVNFTFVTTTTSIRMANFDKMTCLDAIQKLAAFADYEWGFARDGGFFFRPRRFDRNVDYTVKLRSVNEFSRITDGVDRIYNSVVGNYGGHEALIDVAAAGDPGPHSINKYGFRQLAIGANDILVDPDADVATGLTRAYLQQFKNPRRRFSITIDFTPQLELADTVRARITDDMPSPPWHIGDSAVHVGQSTIHLYGHEQQSAYDVIGRVLSVEHDAQNKYTRLELEEII